MKHKSKTRKMLSLLLAAGMLAGAPAIRTEAAVITSNAADKTAVVFNANTAYSAGDYVLYDGEMYICTEDIQGAWGTAEGNFMQLTKNHALGTQEDLSAAYDASADPSKEKSLMAFAANAWQKLKGFFGMEGKDEDIAPDQYKNASVSAKLNFLQKQNQQLDQNVSNLQGWITQSFQSVSNGKSILAAAITDKKGTAGPRDSFQQLGQAIRDLAQVQYNDGHGAGKQEGYQEGYNAGVTFADGRVNESSASYLQGKSEAEYHPQVWETEIKVEKTGPNKEKDCFIEDVSTNHVEYSFYKKFEGITIVAASVEATYSSAFSHSSSKELFARTGGNNYMSLSNAQRHSMYVTTDSISWGTASFNLSDTGACQTLKFRILYI